MQTPSAAEALRGNIIIGVVSAVVGAVVIPYGAGMPTVREGAPGPGLFPMMIGALLILFGLLLILTSVLAVRRERRHLAALAAAGAGGSAAPTDGEAAARGAEEGEATGAAAPAATETTAAEGEDAPPDVPATTAVMDTDIGSDGARRWINGAILMGGIVFYVLFAEVLGFPLTMALLVTAIVWSLRAKWWVALATGVLTSLALWAMFEQGLMVQLPDGLFRGF